LQVDLRTARASCHALIQARRSPKRIIDMLHAGQLTLLERAILEDLARGLEPDQIAIARGLSDVAYDGLMLRARQKLEAKNVIQAVARAALSGALRSAEVLGVEVVAV